MLRPYTQAGSHWRLERDSYSRLFRNSGVSPCSQLARRVKRSVRSSSPRRISRMPAIRSTQTRYGRKDRKSTRLNSSHTVISYAVFCLKKKKKKNKQNKQIE